MADITVNESDSNQIDIDVSDSNNLNLKLTGGDKGLRTHMLETVYPVGSIYINAGVATNPGTLLGFGTWTAFGTGRVIVGVDSSDSDFDTVRETGGSKTDSHALTIAELPAHTHTVTMSTSDSDNDNLSEGNTSGTSSHETSSTGGGQAHTHDIVQPYITAYMWRRTA
tara:strand:+ start:235 stop:738 length:504 start_codon:yes stop_codon:yes gene_type:complete